MRRSDIRDEYEFIPLPDFDLGLHPGYDAQPTPHAEIPSSAQAGILGNSEPRDPGRRPLRRT